jgi:murein DD-endopeptidase MepM/ murein hydrolase activator NlpD
MTRRRRRYRWLRDETVAPWVTLVVILLMWWTGARFFGPERIAGEPMSVARVSDPSPAPVAPIAGGPAAGVAGGQTKALPGKRVASPPVIAPPTREEITALRKRDLLVPVTGVSEEDLRSDFDDKRGSRTHEAIDILAPRGTIVRAVDDGTIARLFTSERGGLTVYQFDDDGRFCFYYAHLDRYEASLKEGAEVERGDTIGYVGTTGNSPPNTPHLHFAIFKLGPDQRWWQGSPIDPYLVLR